MWKQPKDCRQPILKEGGKRMIVIPADFLLEGKEVVVRQEKDGLITIYPGDETGRKAMDAEFGLFSD